MKRKNTITIICILIFLSFVYFYFFNSYEVKISTIIKSFDNVVITQIKQDGSLVNINISENSEANLSKQISELWCKKSKIKNNFLFAGDITLFYGEWCVVFTEEESYVYSLTTDDYYSIKGNAKTQYNDVLAQIQS